MDYDRIPKIAFKISIPKGKTSLDTPVTQWKDYVLWDPNRPFTGKDNDDENIT
jgi:hypothetical protein